ncbi:MAG: hypothetical protein EB010_13300 [Acidimicrobiia bacterium]|nr:hypothetical protein [Acidimicrobiia bacterium]
MSDQTITRVIKYFTAYGEVGLDREASPGNGSYYVALYDGSYDATGFDTLAEAMEELRYATE